MADASRQDWLELTQRAQVRAVAAAIASRWNVWVGLVTRAGSVLPIRAPEDVAGPNLPVCEHFKRCSDDAGLCSTSLGVWARADRPREVSCHAWLGARVVPLTGTGSGQAAVYASGYFESERDFEQMAALLDRAEDLGLDRHELAARLDRVPRLDRAERDALGCLVQVLAATLQRAHLEGASDGSNGNTNRYDYSYIVGQSAEILRLFGILDRVVESHATVLIQGENGTGKELFARAIHTNGDRFEQGFVTQNCAALNDNLLESELFGHVKGAFTGAIADKRGLFELADGGTLFLDEVGDMTSTMQVKLLRVLQEGTFTPVGGTVTRKVDVRVIAATNRYLREMVAKGAFREDLFYRLNVINLVVPPLRDRLDDLPLLVDHFLRDYARRTGQPRKRLADDTLRLLLGYRWPGNVRELRHEIERLVVLSGTSDPIPAGLLSPRIHRESDPSSAPALPDEPTTLPQAVEALERRMISETLAKTDWNKTQAARRLGISRRNLIRKVQSYELEPPSAS